MKKLLATGTHRVAVDAPSLDLRTAAPFQGFVDAENQGTIALIQVLEQQHEQDAGRRTGRPYRPVEHLMVAGVVEVVAAAHDAQRRGHGALARGQYRPEQQHLGFPPSLPSAPTGGRVAKQRCEGNEYGYNDIGQGEHGWAFLWKVGSGQLTLSLCFSKLCLKSSFGATDTEKTFTFAATNDSEDDDGKSVKLGFGTLPTGVSDGTNTETTVNITDSDVPTVIVCFEETSYTALEGGSVAVKVKLSADPERSETVPPDRIEQGGATSADYSEVPENVTFASGDTGKTFTFSAVSDTVDDDDQSEKLGFGTLATGVNPGTKDETMVSITDDDYPANVSSSFGAATYTAAEGSMALEQVTELYSRVYVGRQTYQTGGLGKAVWPRPGLHMANAQGKQTPSTSPSRTRRQALVRGCTR